MKIVLVNSNPIHKALEEELTQKYNAFIINKRKDFSMEVLNNLKPKYIFIPHWSYIIPASIYDNFECIVFHMTDLPYGRGGSPLQNLIQKGKEQTKISALRVTKGIDTGDIYLKKDLSLLGTAEEIFLRASKVIEKMVEEIIDKESVPTPQDGSIVTFKRRKPEESNIAQLKELNKLFDYIRMLDAEGYPKAFLETEYFRLEFSRASLKKDGIIADVRISKK